MLISTGGQELLNDMATVFGFAMNVACSRNIAVVERLVPPVLTERPSSKASTVLRRTLDPGIYLQPADMPDVALRDLVVGPAAEDREDPVSRPGGTDSPADSEAENSPQKTRKTTKNDP